MKIYVILMLFAFFGASSIFCIEHKSGDYPLARENVLIPESKIDGNEFSVEEGRVFTKYKHLTFVLEKVTTENKTKWMEFSKEELRKAFAYSRAMKLEWDFLGPIRTAVNSFEEFIDLYAESEDIKYNENEVWIAYVKNNITHQIEMCFTVTTQKNVPVTTHMGIFRANYSSNRMEQTRGLSLLLHSFAAKAMRSIYPEKQYMYTDSIGDMKKILIKSIPSNGFWHVYWDDESNTNPPFYINTDATRKPVTSELVIRHLDGNIGTYDRPAYFGEANLGATSREHMIFNLKVLESLWP